MTDPDLADSTYIEPLNISILEKIIKKKTTNFINNSGQTALNLSIDLEKNILRKRTNL